jgi:hypothetical protein
MPLQRPSRRQSSIRFIGAAIIVVIAGGVMAIGIAAGGGEHA